MKNGVWSATLIILTLLALLTPPLDAGSLRFELQFSGGLGYIDGGDVHTRLANLGNYWKAFSELPGSPYQFWGKTGYPFRSALEGAIEFRLLLGSRFSVGIGTGYLHATRRSGEDVALRLTAPDSGSEYTYTVGSTVRAIPVTVTGRYSLPLSGRQRLSIQAGAGIYPCRWTMPYDYRVSTEAGLLLNHIDYTATATGIGMHGGLGWEIDLTRRLALVVEALGRLATVDGFIGSWKSRNAQGSSTSGTGTMYFWEWYNGDTAGWYPTIDMFDGAPAPAGKRNIREARVDLSGLSLRVGVKIRL